MAAAIVRRFQEAAEKGEEARKMKDILGMVSRDEVMNWRDDDRLDLLHHCILKNNPEAVEVLLKHGYFVRPYEPEVNLYAHLAAFLGFRTTLSVLLVHRPDDFRIAQQPLFLPPGFTPPVHHSGTSKKASSKSGDGSTTSTSTSNSSSNHRINSSSKRSSSSSSLLSSSSPSKNKDLGSSSSRKGGGGVDGLVTDGSKPLRRTPLDVAARVRQTECVKMMLSACVLKAHPDAPNKGFLTLAALQDCPTSMRLLLEEHSKQDKQTTDDFKAAVEVSVQRARPECLDLLLRKGPRNVDPKQLFKQINFFHVLYTFSASFGKGSYGRLPEVTKVLIKRGHDVNAKLPSRTYPLYTLLTHSFCFHEYNFTKSYVECLRILLENGADPNFDEMAYEKRLRQKQGTSRARTTTSSAKHSSSSTSASVSSGGPAAGRNAFSSALHCLLETVETYAGNMASKVLAVRFVEDCAEVLVKHRADVSKVGTIGDGLSDIQGNVLHQYAKSCVTLGVDKSILRCILRFGAEPDTIVNEKYAINVYFDQLFEMLARCEVVDAGHRYEDDVSDMLTYMTTFMSPAHIRQAAHIFHRTHARARSQQVKYYIDKVQSSLERHSKRVRPLTRLAAWRVWKACGKRADVVRNLPVKVELRTMILPLL